MAFASLFNPLLRRLSGRSGFGLTTGVRTCDSGPSEDVRTDSRPVPDVLSRRRIHGKQNRPRRMATSTPMYLVWQNRVQLQDRCPLSRGSAGQRRVVRDRHRDVLPLREEAQRLLRLWRGATQDDHVGVADPDRPVLDSRNACGSWEQVGEARAHAVLARSDVGTTFVVRSEALPTADSRLPCSYVPPRQRIWSGSSARAKHTGGCGPA